MAFRPACALVLLTALALSEQANACSFGCFATPTFSEEIESANYAMIVRLVAPAPGGDGEDAPPAVFEVETALKGPITAGQRLSMRYFGPAPPGALFFVTTSQLDWLRLQTPAEIFADSAAYFRKLPKLPPAGAGRYGFFLEFVQHDDDLVATDAYLELRNAPFAVLQELRSRMQPDKLREWIQNLELPASRRRLFLNMLAACGDERDLPLLAKFLRSNDRKQKAGLDALIACYVQLGGPERLDLIDDLFLRSLCADYAETFSAIQALRFHATQSSVVPRERLLKSVRAVLERPELADLVIPDLIQLQDWDSLERLMELFREADAKSSWVRTPVVTFLRSCPLSRAAECLKECHCLDPVATNRSYEQYPQVKESP